MVIEELIPENIETKSVEYKRTIEEGKSESGKLKEINWLKTLCAFANTDGGDLYIGVDDISHTINSYRHDEADKIIQMIHRQIRNHVTPLIQYDITAIPVRSQDQTRYIVCVHVPKSTALPVTLHVDGLLGIFVRNYGRTDIASPEQIRDLVLFSENTPYDVFFTDEDFRFEDYSLFCHTAEANGTRLTEKELIAKRIISAQRKVSKGLLLFKDNSQDISTKVIATMWPGVSKGGSVILASEEYHGNLITVIQRSLQFVYNHSASGFIKTFNSREDYIAYPRRAILEGIVNAVAHRNYYVFGSQIEINLFKDRLEITSPGTLLGVRYLDHEKDIASIIPRRRNEIICSILEICRYLEGKGTGFDKIVEDYSQYGDSFSPYVSCNSQSFTLTLPDVTNRAGVVAEEGSLPDVYADGILAGKHDLQILAYCFNKPRTVKEIAEKLGITASTYFRKNTIARLCEQQYLIEIPQDSQKTYKTNQMHVRLK